MMTSQPPSGSRTVPASIWRRVVMAMLLAVPLACSLIVPQVLVPQQQWAAARGPVVPHDTFPDDCSLCHVAGTWQEIREDFQFDHAAKTGVVLHGAHQAAECLRCHNDRGPVAKFSSRGCSGCHEDWHRRQLGTRCDSCHNETNWRPKDVIAKHNRTRFPLVGAHAGIDCTRCHSGAPVGDFKRESTRCHDCHQKDLQRTSNPNHSTAGWTRDCQACHVPIAWKGSAFVHTTFALTGQHSSTDCTKCHLGGIYKGTNRTCEGCHLSDAQQVATPNHTAAGWMTNCQDCHTTVSFDGAHFNHTAWALTGAHTGQACVKCHVGKVYTGTPTNCVGCHLANYNATTNPNHTSSGFSTSCQLCHNTDRWQGAQFNHKFPLTKNHQVSCATCHTNPASYKVFTCLVCHDHRKTKMDDVHKSKSGYTYSSTACYNCHPNGN